MKVCWLLVLAVLCQVRALDIKCSADYCKKNYYELHLCPNIGSCTNGKLLPSMTPCSCCKQCLNILKKGDICSMWETDVTPNQECGSGLQCVSKDKKQEGTCQRIQTPCTEAQYRYDEARANGTLGVMDVRPNCDTEGFYLSYFCLPESICFCVKKNGKRIFGEVASNNFVQSMDCKCSRDWTNFRELGLDGKPPRCLANGNYDTLQCTQDDNCICTDDKNSKVETTDQISKLPCYDPKIHKPHFYTDCEIIRNQTLVDMKAFEEENIIVLGMDIPSCSIDGSYHRVQYKGDTAYCADPDGKLLEDFQVSRGSKAGQAMNCNCARARYLGGKDATGFSKAQCCQNGNYRPWQCNGDICYCVDTYGVPNGTQFIEEMVYHLHCYTDDPCPSVK